MNNLKQHVVDWLSNSAIPQDFSESFGDWISKDDGRFEAQESSHWDYKQSFPFSMSDDYFGGFVRLICSFHNTYGGVIIVGVHDKTRAPGKNSVPVNIERLNNVLRESLSSPVEVIAHHYDFKLSDGTASSIDALLVPKRPMSVVPVRLTRDIGKYHAGIIWLRKHHECVVAKNSDIPMLYSPRTSYGLDLSEAENGVESSIPSSAATLREFIGRFDVLDKLLHWLLVDDEPRKFLWGRGGAGKTTIAHEFSKIIAQCAGSIPTALGKPVDQVIFLSAKKTALDPVGGQLHDVVNYDFGSSSELYQQLLTLSGWMTKDDVLQMDERQLLKELQSLFDTLQVLLVIDDIDTLTTAGIEPGMDTMFRLLSRAKAGGKVLYTLRNAPTHSLQSSIEVPQLNKKTELPQFIVACTKQFKVPMPTDAEVEKIATQSEQRPLAVEVIIGLRRKCDSYERALKLFEGKEGDQARRYLFQREWDALPSDNHARHFLAALHLLNRKTYFDELHAVLQYDEERIKDCIAETIEMFLETEDASDGKRVYGLGRATSEFLRATVQHLQYFDQLKYRVKYFKSSHLPDDPEVSRSVFSLRKFIKRFEFENAVELIESPTLSAKVTQHPQFAMTAGTVYAMLNPPRLDIARKHFQQGIQSKSKDIVAMRDWYWMERNSKYNVDKVIAVCDSVIGGKQFAEFEKAEFLAKKGHTLCFQARQAWLGDPEQSIERYSMALACYMQSLFIVGGHAQAEEEKLEAKYIETIQELLARGLTGLLSDRSDLTHKSLELLFDKELRQNAHFDHWILPLIDALSHLRARVVRHPSAIPKTMGVIQKIQGAVAANKGVRIIDDGLVSKIVEFLRVTMDTLTVENRKRLAQSG